MQAGSIVAANATRNVEIVTKLGHADLMGNASSNANTDSRTTSLTMSEKPNVKPGAWISFGSRDLPKSAVVCTVYDDRSAADIEVVYVDDRDRAINENLVWKDGEWEFLHPGPCGGYADKYDRLRSYVSQLRRQSIQ